MGRNLGDKMIPIVDVNAITFNGDKYDSAPSEFRYKEGLVNVIILWVVIPAKNSAPNGRKLGR